MLRSRVVVHRRGSIRCRASLIFDISLALSAEYLFKSDENLNVSSSSQSPTKQGSNKKILISDLESKCRGLEERVNEILEVNQEQLRQIGALEKEKRELEFLAQKLREEQQIQQIETNLYKNNISNSQEEYEKLKSAYLKKERTVLEQLQELRGRHQEAQAQL